MLGENLSKIDEAKRDKIQHEHIEAKI